MHNSSNELLGKWIFELVLQYFIEQKKQHAEKLFLKIAGVDDTAISAVLNVFRNLEPQLALQYKPIIRTLKHVEGFEDYRCNSHETSTWLRNNTLFGSSLIIFLNDNSPEAQSLENIFTIDEARLMSTEGLNVLFKILAEQVGVYPEELNTLKTFFSMFQKITEPQLRNVLSFMVGMIEDPKISIIDKIQGHLNELLLFCDNKLQFTQKEGLPRLRKNYSLSRFERDGRATNKEELVNNLYNFLNSEESNHYEHEIWEHVDPETFRRHALEFINNQSTTFLKYEFDLVSSVFQFKTKKPKTNQKVAAFVEQLEKELSSDQSKLLSDTMEAIDEGNNPEMIQEFIEEFNDELATEPRLRKELERLVERQRHPHEYQELTDALLYESFIMIEEVHEDEDINDPQFQLSILDQNVSESVLNLLKFYLCNLENVIPRIRFDSTSLPNVGDKEKESNVSFELKLFLNGKEHNSRKFRLMQITACHLPAMIEQFRDEQYIPYIKEYFGSDSQLINVLQDVEERIKGYIAIQEPGVKEAYEDFHNFVVMYTSNLNKSLEQGICKLDLVALEQELEKILQNIHRSTLISKHIYQYLSCLGALDRYKCKKNEIGAVCERTLTLLNPIRLVSYLKRMGKIQDELNKWIGHLMEGSIRIEEIDDYLQHVSDTTAHLSPHYFVAEGVTGQYLIEQQERMGEGSFAVNGNSSGEEQLVETFAEELLSTVKTYFEVYPYAKDCLDLVFLYCPHAEYVTKAVDYLFKNTGVQKIKVVVHSDRKGAIFHEYFNNWLSQEEQYWDGYNKFPKVDIQVIAEKDINQITQVLSNNLQDADIGVLVNYFGQTSHIQYRLEKVDVKDSDEWFETVYKEPLKKDEAIKRISYVSERLPKVMQYFYQMQYILQSNEKIGAEENFLLRNVISITNLSDTHLINFMHDRFNWSLFIDRYLDKSLLRQVSSKAQIIRYKSKAGKNKDYRTILSSSNYIRKLANEITDHAYYDRLYQKYVAILKNHKIDRNIIIQAVERVKEISGGVVLRAIGPGKFAHELMAIYLSTQSRIHDDTELYIWSVCDELPWFQRSQRRPDLVGTKITKVDEQIHVEFELVELKFLSHGIFDTERHDAIKQVKAGVELYRNLFSFSKEQTNAELWRKELIHYLLEFGTYSVEHAQLLREIQSIPLERIQVNIKNSIDTFVYTSNLFDHYTFEEQDNGHKSELLLNEYTNHIYNRAYILEALGATKEQQVPVYEEIQELNSFVTSSLGLTEIDDQENIHKEEQLDNIGETNSILSNGYGDNPVINEQENDYISSLPFVAATSVEKQNKESESMVIMDKTYPELVALKNEIIQYEDQYEDVTPLVEGYYKKLRYNFNNIGIPVKIVDTVIGVSVIRIIIEIPGEKSYSSVENRTKDIQLWLQLSSEPLVAIRNGRINIDINRDKPEIVYFEKFMEMVRRDLQNQIQGKLLAPLGVGQLNEVISMDFSSPDTPHLLVGGRTGSGKSVTINSIILAMMCLYQPSEVQFIFIDPKKVEFLTYENRRHTMQVITELEEAVSALENLVEEMELRYRLFAQESVTSIDQYVEMTSSQLPRLVVVFDEFADFMVQEKNLSSRVENSILRLGAKARAAGIHLLICTQNPKADIVPTNIRNNLPARLALRAADHHASKIILDEEGAEKLGGKGDFLTKLESSAAQRGKSPFLTVNVKRALLQYFKNIQN
ncbi:FtsK/SpoIIIE domain-containing protein [Paenibacillus sp. OAS669]|uniref:FtsK/SpoIIIE domain-containing protein n=1 Tax=Paenibacillus sp. OAS669 TaxID=2663821 RepID=UPI001789430F|nr:FtsK/SpoIIIE domain-containing protein [Paenibacillus sp. OAS669]MBE1444854.1 S-DNA-T family DNA segregation ATPase FtsK/SpoIIIE [Paenibacillus sp. OAS669]